MYSVKISDEDYTISYYLTLKGEIVAVARFCTIHEHYIKLLWFENYTLGTPKYIKGLGRKVLYKALRDIRVRFPYYKLMTLYPTSYTQTGKYIKNNKKLVNFYKRLGFLTLDQFKNSKLCNLVSEIEMSLFCLQTMFYVIKSS